MVRRPQRCLALFGSMLLLVASVAASPAWAAMNPWNFPPPPPPDQYGNVLINRTSAANKVQAVGFAHWSHRTRYTCRVCHEELGFAMFVNTTEITEEENRQGQFCGACHNGKIAFGHTKENCQKCHTGTLVSKTGFSQLFGLPKAPYGNHIDWVYAQETNLITPKKTLFPESYQPMAFNKTLNLESRWTGTPPAIFPHDVHNQWLDCSNCHPDIFNIKKKTTEHFEMGYILDRKFCGVCHLNVAFPLDDCQRCHPKMEN